MIKEILELCNNKMNEKSFILMIEDEEKIQIIDKKISLKYNDNQNIMISTEDDQEQIILNTKDLDISYLNTDDIFYCSFTDLINNTTYTLKTDNFDRGIDCDELNNQDVCETIVDIVDSCYISHFNIQLPFFGFSEGNFHIISDISENTLSFKIENMDNIIYEKSDYGIESITFLNETGLKIKVELI